MRFESASNCHWRSIRCTFARTLRFISPCQIYAFHHFQDRTKYLHKTRKINYISCSEWVMSKVCSQWPRKNHGCHSLFFPGYCWYCFWTRHRWSVGPSPSMARFTSRKDQMCTFRGQTVGLLCLTLLIFVLKITAANRNAVGNPTVSVSMS